MTVTFAQAIEPVTADIWVKTLGPLFLCILCAYMYLHMHKSPENATRIKSWTVFWFILSGMIHSELEFSFIFFRNNSWSSKALDLYSAADFRYGYPMEAGTAAMELITALIDGPLCLLAAYGYVHRRYWYHPVVLVVTTMQLYGLTWYVVLYMQGNSRLRLQQVCLSSNVFHRNSCHVRSNPLLVHPRRHEPSLGCISTDSLVQILQCLVCSVFESAKSPEILIAQIISCSRRVSLQCLHLY